METPEFPYIKEVEKPGHEELALLIVKGGIYEVRRQLVVSYAEQEGLVGHPISDVVEGGSGGSSREDDVSTFAIEYD